MENLKMRYPTSFQATDSVILDKDRQRLLLGRKKGSKFWRFCGGFVDPKDNSLEEASLRERREEAGTELECSPPKYLFSFRVEDPRYLKGPDKVMSAVFLYNYIFGRAIAGDDIEECCWFDSVTVKNDYTNFMAKEHWPLAARLVLNEII